MTEIRRQNFEKWGDLGFLGKITIIRTGFLQNKANFHQAKMNAKPIKTKDYEKRCAFRVHQKQSQTKPISSFTAENAEYAENNSIILHP